MRKGVDYPGVSLCFVCHDGNGRFLLQKRTKQCRDEHNTWDTGAGGLRFGEAVLDGLKRELREELNVEPLAIEFLGFREAHREHNGEQTHWIALDHKVLIDPAHVKIGEPHKISEVKWFTLDEFPSPLHSMVPLFFSMHKNKL